MAVLEDLKPNSTLRGILPSGAVTVVTVQWYGSEAIELTYKDAGGKVANELDALADASGVFVAFEVKMHSASAPA